MKFIFKNNSYHSTGEYEIAKFLDKMDIAFEYEFPIAVIDDKKTKIWYPDFYLKEYQMVIEYFGMYDHNEVYRENAEHKKEVYKNCGIQFVPIYNIKTDKWQEYLLNSIFTYLDYKRNTIAKKQEKLEKTSEAKSIFERFIPKMFKRDKIEDSEDMKNTPNMKKPYVKKPYTKKPFIKKEHAEHTKSTADGQQNSSFEKKRYYKKRPYSKDNNTNNTKSN